MKTSQDREWTVEHALGLYEMLGDQGRPSMSTYKDTLDVMMEAVETLKTIAAVGSTNPNIYLFAQTCLEKIGYTGVVESWEDDKD